MPFPSPAATAAALATLWAALLSTLLWLLSWRPRPGEEEVATPLVQAAAQPHPDPNPPPPLPPAKAAARKRLFALKSRKDGTSWSPGSSEYEATAAAAGVGVEAGAVAEADAGAAAALAPPRSAPVTPPDWAAVVRCPDFEAFLTAFNDGAALAAAHAGAPELSRLAVSPWVAAARGQGGPPPTPIPGGPLPGTPGCAPPPTGAGPACRTLSFTPAGVAWLPPRLGITGLGTNELGGRGAPGEGAVMVGAASIRLGGGGGKGGGGGGGARPRPPFQLTASVMTVVPVTLPSGASGARLELRCTSSLPPWLDRGPLGGVARKGLVTMSGAFAGRSAAWAAGVVGGEVVNV